MIKWFVIIMPDFYDDPCDLGYDWCDEAESADDAVQKALLQCLEDNDNFETAEERQEYLEDAKIAAAEPTINPMVRIVTVHPDWQGACSDVFLAFGPDDDKNLTQEQRRAVQQIRAYGVAVQDPEYVPMKPSKWEAEHMPKDEETEQ